ncbi:antibiotic biosynthesis monooxygenase [Bacteroides sp. 214]|uniref:putative quinol monooxygenase n=1 Tax=Bacteroides sp. 214 TaxID=2302935 RepID=UPI0013D4ADB3|nr:putative quinol monooxygenase [Bacteroides sp. 214]NDW13663.1 antibiotic biosynthesis monooxygenase [Bacteroides sp. 214]
MEKKTIVARAEVISGKESAFILLAEALVKATREETGNISYTLYQNPANPSSFIFYEEYRDDAAIKNHADSLHFKAFATGIEGMLASKLVIETF